MALPTTLRWSSVSTTSNDVTLQWDWVPEDAIQMRSSLSPLEEWQTLTNRAQLVAGKWSVHLKADGSTRFFR